MKKTTIVISSLAMMMFSLIGCTPAAQSEVSSLFINPTYQEPASGKFAFFNYDSGKSLMDVEIRFFKNAKNCSGMTEVSSSWIKNQSRQPLKIKANQEFTFEIGYDSFRAKYCGFAVSFLPIANESYLIYFDLDNDSCGLTISRMYKGRLLPVKFKEREQSAPFFASGSFCEPEKV